MSTTQLERATAAEVIAGYMSGAAIFLSAIALAIRPLPVALAALVLSLCATAIGGRWGNLHAIAVAAATLGFVLGMTIAVLTGRPLY